MREREVIQFDSFLKLIPSSQIRIFLIVSGFIVIVLYRMSVSSFGVSLGYLYVLLIALSGLWFGLKGGMSAALITMAIHVVEIKAFSQFPHRDLVSTGFAFRFCAYFFGGLMIGYFSESGKKLRRRLYQLARNDELTGCTNYRFTMEHLEREVARARRYQKELTLAIIDIDYFKEINDTYGHPAGNEVLERFAQTLKGSLREIDVAGRFGGDEFMLILPETNAEQARLVLERIKEKLAKTPFTISEGGDPVALYIEFSAGIASLPQHADDMNELLEVVDDALYQAKREGRNRVFMERRRQRRLKPPSDLTIELQPNADHAEAFSPSIVNLSPQGMLASSAVDIPQGDFLCRLSLGGGEVSTECKCNVIYNRKSEENIYYIGTSFIGVPPRFQQLIRNSGVSLNN
jgi:diguanylate cyclase (GGDEF)-like protein